jgi:polyhydroxyalkanoate synthesis regulator phasin
MSVIKNIVYLGIGMASLTREKIEEAVEELVKRGEVASGDRGKAIDELQQRAHAAAAEVRKVVDERIDAVAKRFRWIDDIRKLQGQLEQMEARLETLEKSGKASSSKKSEE